MEMSAVDRAVWCRVRNGWEVKMMKVKGILSALRVTCDRDARYKVISGSASQGECRSLRLNRFEIVEVNLLDASERSDLSLVSGEPRYGQFSLS